MGTQIELKEINSLHDLKQFVSFQYRLYNGNKFWVPPIHNDELFTLRKDKNPAFDFCDAKYWLALKDGVIAGRIACIINRKYNEKWNTKSARFGWFDFIDDYEISSAL